MVPHHLRVCSHHDLDEIFTWQGSTWSPSHGGIRFHFRVLAILLAQIISSSLHGVVSVTFQTILLLGFSRWRRTGECCLVPSERSHGLSVIVLRSHRNLYPIVAELYFIEILDRFNNASMDSDSKKKILDWIDKTEDRTDPFKMLDRKIIIKKKILNTTLFQTRVYLDSFLWKLFVKRYLSWNIPQVDSTAPHISRESRESSSKRTVQFFPHHRGPMNRIKFTKKKYELPFVTYDVSRFYDANGHEINTMINLCLALKVLIYQLFLFWW